LRQEAQSDSMNSSDFLASIRLRPRFFWFIAATLSQLVAYYIPRIAFELFCVKKQYAE